MEDTKLTFNDPTKRSPADEQLVNFKNSKKVPDTLLTQWGKPIVYKDAALTVGPDGNMLLEDNDFLVEVSAFDRERIPERVVHAKGTGAFGHFEVTHDITKYSAAKVFSKIGQITPIAVRFSQGSGELGSADTVRDVRGFAIKFYTEDGMWDIASNNSPMSFVRDPILLPSFFHSQKRNPETNVPSFDARWDFATLRLEVVHSLLYLFGDRGIPLSYRHINGYGQNTFKLVNGEREAVYCKFIYHSNQSVKNMDTEDAARLAGSDPDYYVRDLYNAIAEGEFPSWTFYIQVMTIEQSKKSPFNPFDPTKTWPRADFPLIPVGKFVLNRNPSNFFEEIEQIAFSPANLVPGIEPSPDKVLHGRMFAYHDTQLYRLGTNYRQIPVNSPYRSDIPKNYARDGTMAINNQGGAPNYHPNSFKGPLVDPRAQHMQPKFPVGGEVYRHDTDEEDNFSQARILYSRVFDAAQRQRVAQNFAADVGRTASFIMERVLNDFLKPISPQLAQDVKREIVKLQYLDKNKADKKTC